MEEGSFGRETQPSGGGKREKRTKRYEGSEYDQNTSSTHVIERYCAQ